MLSLDSGFHDFLKKEQIIINFLRYVQKTQITMVYHIWSLKSSPCFSRFYHLGCKKWHKHGTLLQMTYTITPQGNKMHHFEHTCFSFHWVSAFWSFQIKILDRVTGAISKFLSTNEGGYACMQSGHILTTWHTWHDCTINCHHELSWPKKCSKTFLF